MNFRLNWLFVLLLIASAGCQIPSEENSFNTDTNRGANGIGLFLPYYVGIFGDDQPTWGGMWYTKENLSIIAHLPTKSEFFICVRKPPESGSDLTNNLHAIVRRIQEKAGANTFKETWETITQEVSIRKKTSRLSFNYLRSEFIGTRADTDRYSKTDRVLTVVYVACLTPEKPAAKALYSVAVVMIPVNVPKEEQERLLDVLGNFLRDKITLPTNSG